MKNRNKESVGRTEERRRKRKKTIANKNPWERERQERKIKGGVVQIVWEKRTMIRGFERKCERNVKTVEI